MIRDIVLFIMVSFVGIVAFLFLADYKPIKKPHAYGIQCVSQPPVFQCIIAPAELKD